MTELGPIPVDWEVKRIDQCGDVVTGSTPPRGVSELWGGSFNWISAKDFKGKFIVSSEEKVTEAGKRYCRTLPANSVLVTCIASIGLNAIAKRPCATNQQINAVICRDCDYEYFYYQCCFNESRLRQMAGQTAVPIIGKSQFEEFTIAFPKEIKEQRRIAGALSDVDELISALGKLIEKKRNIKTGTMQQLLTGKTRLPGFGAKRTEFKQTELGPIPVDWEVKRFDKVFSMLRNNTYARESLTDEREGAFNIHYGDILVKYGALVDFEKDEVPCLKFGIEPNKDMLQDGDLIFADTAEDEMVGKAIEVTGVNGCRAVAGLHTVLCRPNASVFAPGYLGYYINSHAYHNQLIPLITGTKVSSVSRAGFASTYVCIPPFAEQKAIAAVLSDMDAEIAALESDRAKYERIKSGMMQELLTGKTRLKP